MRKSWPHPVTTPVMVFTVVAAPAVSSAAAAPALAHPLAFTDPVSYPSLNQLIGPISVVTGDITGDGRADLVQVYTNSFNGATDTEVVVYVQKANGKLAAPVIAHAAIIV